MALGRTHHDLALDAVRARTLVVARGLAVVARLARLAGALRLLGAIATVLLAVESFAPASQRQGKQRST